jgi:hypothetical protein
MDGPSAPFAREHWTVIEGHPLAPGQVCAVRCDAFDPATRQCTAYGDRPPICSGFPWYGAPPDPGRDIDPWCAYMDDVRPLLPIVAVNHG